MKKNSLTSIIKYSLLLTLPVVSFVSCNKELPKPVPIENTAANGTTVGDLINNTGNYSFFKTAAARIGATALLSDRNSRWTVFLPDNAAFIASGIPSEAVIGALPITTIGAIVNYHIIPGEDISSAMIPTTFPNLQMPTLLGPGSNLPGTIIPFRLTTFPSKRGSSLWVNNIPLITPDIKAVNGTIHIVGGVISPPAKTLRDTLYGRADLTYFRAAVARGDSGQVGTARFDSLMNYAVTNMTVLAPNDAAFQTLLFGSIYSYLIGQGVPAAIATTQATLLSSTPAIFTNPASYAILPAAAVRGILAYHLLASPNPATGAFEPNIRAFGVNFPAASPSPFFVKTLVNSSVAIHPGIIASATFTGPLATGLSFTGLGTFPPGGAPYSGPAATATARDIHGINGVGHVINRVLLPQ